MNTFNNNTSIFFCASLLAGCVGQRKMMNTNEESASLAEPTAPFNSEIQTTLETKIQQATEARQEISELVEQKNKELIAYVPKIQQAIELVNSASADGLKKAELLIKNVDLVIKEIEAVTSQRTNTELGKRVDSLLETITDLLQSVTGHTTDLDTTDLEATYHAISKEQEAAYKQIDQLKVTLTSVHMALLNYMPHTFHQDWLKRYHQTKPSLEDLKKTDLDANQGEDEGAIKRTIRSLTCDIISEAATYIGLTNRQIQSEALKNALITELDEIRQLQHISEKIQQILPTLVGIVNGLKGKLNQQEGNDQKLSKALESFAQMKNSITAHSASDNMAESMQDCHLNDERVVLSKLLQIELGYVQERFQKMNLLIDAFQGHFEQN